MDAFAIIGLMLSLFGGTYAAMSAIKAWSDPFVARQAEQRATSREELKKYQHRPHTLTSGKIFNGILATICFVYHAAQAAPVIGFSVFSLWMAHWATNNFGAAIPAADAGWWKGLIGFSFWFSISCLGVVLLTLAFAWLFGWILKVHCKTAMENAAEDVSRAGNGS